MANLPSSSPLYPCWAEPLSDGVVIGLVAANGAATLTANFADAPSLDSGTCNVIVEAQAVEQA